MKRIILILLLAVVAAGGYYYYKSLKGSPEYALLQAAEATQTHNMNTFERFVDVDAVTGSLVDDMARQSSLISGLLPGGGLLLRGGLGLLKPQLAKAAHAEVQRFVETGSLEEARAAAPKRLVNISFLGLAGRVVGPDSHFKGIKYSNEEGDQAVVGVEFTQPRYDTTAVVAIELRKQADGHWQAKRIANTQDLLQQVARQAGKHLLH